MAQTAVIYVRRGHAVFFMTFPTTEFVTKASLPLNTPELQGIELSLSRQFLSIRGQFWPDFDKKKRLKELKNIVKADPGNANANREYGFVFNGGTNFGTGTWEVYDSITLEWDIIEGPN